MIKREELNKLTEAAKLIENDGTDGIESAAKVVGPQIAMGMLVSFLIAKKHSGYPLTDEVIKEVEDIINKAGLIE